MSCAIRFTDRTEPQLLRSSQRSFPALLIPLVRHPGAGRDPAFNKINVTKREARLAPMSKALRAIRHLNEIKLDPGLRRDDGEWDVYSPKTLDPLLDCPTNYSGHRTVVKDYFTYFAFIS